MANTETVRVRVVGRGALGLRHGEEATVDREAAEPHIQAGRFAVVDEGKPAKRRTRKTDDADEGEQAVDNTDTEADSE